jgi:ornithine cyclodeaminase
MLILSDDDVRAAVPMALAVDVNAAAFTALEDGSAQCPDRAILSAAGGPTLFKPACVPQDAPGAPEALGLKVVSVRAANAQAGLPTVPATMLMLDAVTGLPSAVLAATWLTALRTAAGSAVATRALAPLETRNLVVFGAGMQAEAHISGMLCVRPCIASVAIVNRGRPRAQALAGSLAAAHPAVAVEVLTLDDVSGVERVCRVADLICATTNSSTPLWDGAWMKPGTHVNAIGSCAHSHAHRTSNGMAP